MASSEAKITENNKVEIAPLKLAGLANDGTTATAATDDTGGSGGLAAAVQAAQLVDDEDQGNVGDTIIEEEDEDDIAHEAKTGKGLKPSLTPLSPDNRMTPRTPRKFKERISPRLPDRKMPEPHKLALPAEKADFLSMHLKKRLSKQEFEAKFAVDEKEQRKNKLADLLAKRPDAAKLQSLNILKGGTTRIQAQAADLAKAQTRDKLQSLLQARPALDEVQKRHIFKAEEDSKASSTRLATAKTSLGDLLLMRPKAEMLVKNKILADIGDLPGTEKKSIGNQLIPSLVVALRDIKITKFACGWGHTTVVDDHGDVYTFGTSSNGRLGNGDTKSEARATPAVVQALKVVGPATAVENGDNHSAAIVAGKLYTWGVGSWGRLGLGHSDDVSIPALVDTGDAKIVQIATGAYHTVSITDNGRVLSFGWNKNGRIGCGFAADIPPVITAPIEAKFAGGVKVVFVAAGQDFSLAITDTGRLYSWGSGSFGALGHGDEKDCSEPRAIVAVADKQFKRVAAGAYHVLALANDGDLYSWGQNTSKQLGRDDSKDTSKGQPGLVSIPGVDKSVATSLCQDLACGKSHSAVIATAGKLYTWGSGARGILGHGDEAAQAAPKLVEALALHRCVQVECSWVHTGVLTDDGQFWTMGSKENGKLGY